MHEPSDSLPQASAAQIADVLMWPLLVLRADGTLLHANRGAHRLLSTRRLLTLRPDRRLGLLPEHWQAEFDAALANAAQGLTVVLNWPASASTRGNVGNLSPLIDRRNQPPGGADLLLALSATEQPNAQVQACARVHRLSPAETRVLQRLALGDSGGEAALALGVSAATVRSQVISLRRKSGQASVVQVLRTLARMPPVTAQTPSGLQAG